MSMWQDLFRDDSIVPETKTETITLSQLWERMASQGMSGSSQSVTPENAMRCTTVHGIVRVLTTAIGSYPPSVGILRDAPTGQYVEEQPGHNLNRLFRRPNAVQTCTEFVRMAVQHLALYGNFYALKGQGQTGPIGFLRPIENPDYVAIDDVNWQTGITWRVQFDGEQRMIPQRQMLHISNGMTGEDGITGQSPILLAKEAIGICLAAEEMMAQLYGNGSIPATVLTGGHWDSQEQYELWADKWRQFYGSKDRRGGTALMPEGMGLEQLTFSPVDAQVLEMRKFQRIEIAQVYGIPPHRLADLERATFSNIEEQSLELVRDVAAPWVKLIQQAMQRDLLTDSDTNAGVVIRFDMESATEGKFKERMEGYRAAYEVGAMNPNEIRGKIKMDPRKDEGGEEFVTAMNMESSSDVDDQSEAEESGDDDTDAGTDKSSIRAVRP